MSSSSNSILPEKQWHVKHEVSEVFERYFLIPGIIAKDTGANSFSFTASGDTASYESNSAGSRWEMRAVRREPPVA